MIITPVKTDIIEPTKQNLRQILDKAFDHIEEECVIAITSKIVSICEGNIVPIISIEKSKLIRQESALYIPPERSKYNITLTIKDNVLIPTAGIDESNGNGYYILWPKDAQKTANDARNYLQEKFSLNKIGVIITDSKSSPLRMGTTGICLAHSGFYALNNYIDLPDLFGNLLHVTKSNIADGLAACAVLVCGEGNEQTPLAYIGDLPQVHFNADNPSQEELSQLHILIKEDLYAPILTSSPWIKGEKSY